MEIEIFKHITGYENYQISNLGNVKSLNYLNTGKEKILKFSKNKSGYLYIGLYNNGIPKNKSIQRLVALEFIPNPENKKEVNHIDGNKHNNRVDNLEWCTPRENMLHSYSAGLRKVTENHHFYNKHPFKGKFGKDNKWSKGVSQFSKDLVFIKNWGGMNEIERELGISQGNISSCCNGRLKTAGKFIWRFNTI